MSFRESLAWLAAILFAFLFIGNPAKVKGFIAGVGGLCKSVTSM